jgi:hypothetical protein
MSLRGVADDEAISFSDKDCFAPLAKTWCPEFANFLLPNQGSRCFLSARFTPLLLPSVRD